MRGLQLEADDRLLVGPETLDDAGVVVLREGEGMPPGSAIGLVQTVDFFPPVVDDPYFYGAIAAANSLSDVYAMGGRPLSVLNLAAFPEDFPEDWRREILRGGFDKVREAGAVVAGGHTVESDVQFGFAVTGLCDPAAVRSNAGAGAGDRLYLTKPLGMGVITTAAKKGKIGWDAVEPAARQMATLNDRAAEAMNAAGASACTDVTGFGLIGHGRNVAQASELTLVVEAAAVPLFEGSLELARRGLFSGGAARGRASLGSEVGGADGVERALVDLFFDAETSGGLLIAVPEERASVLEAELSTRDLPVHAIGFLRERGPYAIELL